MEHLIKFRSRMAGKIRYPEDRQSKKMLYALPISAKTSPGILKKINLPPLPKEIYFISAKDIPGKNTLILPDDKIPLLADKEIKYPGQFIGILVGKEKQKLYNLAPLIDIELTKTPLYPPSTILTKENSAGYKKIEKGDPYKGLAKSYKQIEDSLTINLPPLQFFPGYSAFCSKEGGTYRLSVQSQWPSLMRKNCALIAGISRKQVSLNLNPVGRTPDAYVWQSLPFGAMALLCTSILRSPIKLLAPQITPYSHPLKVSYKIGFDTEGKLLALFCKGFIDFGFSKVCSQEILSRTIIALMGAYHCRNIKIELSGYLSNNPSSLPFFGWGGPRAHYGIEQIANLIAQELGQSPGEWRYNNIFKKGNVYSTGGIVKQDFPLNQMIEDTIKRSDYTRKHGAYKQLSYKEDDHSFLFPVKKGIGMGLSYQGYNMLTKDKQLSSASITMTLEKDSKLTVLLNGIPSTASLLVYWQKMICNQLNIEEKNLTLELDKEDEQSFFGPSVLSRSINISTRLIEGCCDSIQKRRFRETLPITEVKSYRRRAKTEWDGETLTGVPYQTPSFCVLVLELHINTLLKQVEIPEIWITIDCGLRLNSESTRSFIESEVKLALSQCLEKELMNSSLFPHLNINFVQKGKKPKGLETLILGSLPSAFLQAFNQATAKVVKELPLTNADLILCPLKENL